MNERKDFLFRDSWSMLVESRAAPDKTSQTQYLYYYGIDSWNWKDGAGEGVGMCERRRRKYTVFILDCQHWLSILYWSVLVYVIGKQFVFTSMRPLKFVILKVNWFQFECGQYYITACK